MKNHFATAAARRIDATPREWYTWYTWYTLLGRSCFLVAGKKDIVVVVVVVTVTVVAVSHIVGKEGIVGIVRGPGQGDGFVEVSPHQGDLQLSTQRGDGRRLGFLESSVSSSSTSRRRKISTSS
jgi:hypothetical protein